MVGSWSSYHLLSVTLTEINSSTLKMDGWKTIQLPFWVSAYFRGLVLWVAGRVARGSQVISLVQCLSHVGCLVSLSNQSQIPCSMSGFQILRILPGPQKICADWENDMPWCFPVFPRTITALGDGMLSFTADFWRPSPLRRPETDAQTQTSPPLGPEGVFFHHWWRCLWVLWQDDDDDLRKLWTIHIWGWILTWYEGRFYRYV